MTEGTGLDAFRGLPGSETHLNSTKILSPGSQVMLQGHLSLPGLIFLNKGGWMTSEVLPAPVELLRVKG